MSSTVCNLEDRHCAPCEGGVDAFDEATARQMLADVPGWDIADSGKALVRRFEFKGFYRTMAFINAMAWIANRENHHPDFSAGYNYCDVTFTTHAIGGLSENDFICAAKVSALID
ncbi:4a-hydroxytetrahydrobiopterin dehydratase [Marinihelvus fidelis]|uniref:Putative pterin-4-alpha-carbinolamine dehydratase n=1 Tax=Marinihelvus fidelis TaxID=2613842 RepID=A0A5N0TFE7_9GAMM|nr:4a-hydroxytetrahydrobiopterin dehydratase [Marinihelvus fidelis]KAA9133341.1 4a-hydroxytetrahydrobiopterin dehydratase [Marinihelvus fidelis]